MNKMVSKKNKIKKEDELMKLEPVSTVTQTGLGEKELIKEIAKPIIPSEVFKNEPEFVINELQYDALVKSHLEIKEIVLKLQQEVLTLKFTTYSVKYKGKYWIWYDEIGDKTWIQEEDKDDVIGYSGLLTNADALKEYLSD